MSDVKRPADSGPPTMSDIANLAGVSKATVSAVISGTNGNNTRVGEATRQKILTAAKELNYSPNGIARMFRHRTTDIVGLYLGDWLLNTHDLFLAEVVSGLQMGCYEYEKDLLIHRTFRSQDVDGIYLELISRKIDGLIMFTSENDPLAIRLASSSLPVVAIADPVESLPSVVADDRKGSRLIVQYLAERGHRHVLYRRGWKEQTSANRRYEAFVAESARLGVQISEDKHRSDEYDFVISQGEQDILRRPLGDRPSAIVGASDRLAFAALEYCQDNDFVVPDDFAIVGFDGIATQTRPAVRLTTIQAPWSMVAQTAFKLVVDAINGLSIPMETVLPVELVVGDTA